MIWIPVSILTVGSVFLILVVTSAARLRSQARRCLEDLEQMRTISPSGAPYEEGA